MGDLNVLKELQNWIKRQNDRSLIHKPGNRGNRVTPHLYNIIYNNNINIIDSEDGSGEPVTPGQNKGVTGVTESTPQTSEPSLDRLPRLPRKEAKGNQKYLTISDGLPQLPRVPPCGGEGETDPVSVSVFLSGFLSWVDQEINSWPRATRESLPKIQAWFEGKGYREPASIILAFVTMRELIKKSGGPIVLDPELIRLERLGQELFGPETKMYLEVGDD